MSTSLRIISILLGLLGLERIIYADVFTIAPGMMEPTPALNMSIGLAILVAAIGLFLGYGWARWPAIIGATYIALQGLAHVAWSLSRSPDPGIALGLIEPFLGVAIVIRLLRHWPPGVSWKTRLS